MRLVIVAATVLVIAHARPETYRENEEFQYSRSSSDDGSKSGYYGAQRGNMGGNYEKAHNMDTLAQHQLSSVVGQVDGELGSGADTRTGSVFTAGNSRGIYGSGKYDLSNLRGRNFAEGTSYGDSHSSAYSQSSGYHGETYSANNARYRNQQSRLLNQNAGYRGVGESASFLDNQREDDLQHSSSNQYSNQAANSYKYHSQSSNHGSSSYDQSIIDSNAASGSAAASSSAAASGSRRFASPVRLYVRPGVKTSIPVSVHAYDASKFDSSLALTEQNQENYAGSGLHSRPKHYESSYSYKKEWEKHDTQPYTVIPTENPFPKHSDLYDNSQNLQQSSLTRDSSYNGYSANAKYSNSHKSSYESDYKTEGQHLASSSDLQAYTANNRKTQNAGEINNLVEDFNSKPKSYQSSYSYHKSWERRGDPYVIIPADNGQTAQRLTAASSTNSQRSTHQLGSRFNYAQQGYSEDCDCDENGHIRVARSYNDKDYQNYQQQSQALYDLGQQRNEFPNLDLGQQTQNQWDNIENLDQETQQKWDHLENLDQNTQQKQNEFSNLEDLGQQTQNQWDKIENLGQETQQKLDHLESLDQNTQDVDSENLAQRNQLIQNKLEDLGQQTQSKWDNLEDLGQQTQSKWDNLETLSQQQSNIDNLANLGQQTQHKWDNLEELGQQSQNKWDNLGSLNQQEQNKFENLGQEVQNKWDQLEDLTQHTQNNEQFEGSGIQTQNKWNNLETLNQKSENSLQRDNLEQQAQNTWHQNSANLNSGNTNQHVQRDEKQQDGYTYQHQATLNNLQNFQNFEQNQQNSWKVGDLQQFTGSSLQENVNDDDLYKHFWDQVEHDNKWNSNSNTGFINSETHFDNSHTQHEFHTSYSSPKNTDGSSLNSLWNKIDNIAGIPQEQTHTQSTSSSNTQEENNFWTDQHGTNFWDVIQNENADQQNEFHHIPTQDTIKPKSDFDQSNDGEWWLQNSNNFLKPQATPKTQSMHPVNVGRGDIESEDTSTESINNNDSFDKLFEKNPKSTQKYKNQQEIELLSLKKVDRDNSREKENSDDTINNLSVLGLERPIQHGNTEQKSNIHTNLMKSTYTTTEIYSSNNKQEPSPRNLISQIEGRENIQQSQNSYVTTNKDENFDQQFANNQFENFDQEGQKLEEQSLVHFDQNLQDIQQLQQFEPTDTFTKIHNEELQNQNLEYFPLNNEQSPQNSWNTDINTQQINVLKESEEKRLRAFNLESIKKEDDGIIVPVEVTTEKPGFWKSVGNKLSNAKESVVSWFKRS